MKKIIRAVVMIAVIAAVIAAVWYWKNSGSGGTEYVFKTERAERGDIARTISASGTVEPEELVNVGAQVNGKIMSFGTDAEGKKIDYRSQVKAGMVLAQIDDVLYAAELRQCKAEKLQAEAAITAGKADIRQAKAREVLAERNWLRAQELYNKKAMAKSDFDAAESEWHSTQADTAAAEAALKKYEAQLAIAEAALVKAQRNMDYCVITSPVDGIIIDRRVSIGQTVVSNMSASSIFLIAKEFKKMQVWVSVNEADIGSIHPGMAVEFTVDAFPGTTFRGEVHKIRLNATMSQNVVTYIVEVVTDNSDGKLIPYLTANVKFILAEKKDVVNVSNAALRFRPAEKLVAPEYRNTVKKSAPGERYIWIASGNKQVRPVAVKTGLNAGGRVEIVAGDIPADAEIVYAVSELKKDEVAKAGAAKSPFMPEPPKRGNRGSGSAAVRAREQAK